jgi:hypothetical protein
VPSSALAAWFARAAPAQAGQPSSHGLSSVLPLPVALLSRREASPFAGTDNPATH